MEEMGNTFTRVHGAKWSVGRFPRPQGSTWPVARRILSLGEAPGIDLREEAVGGGVGGVEVDGEEVNHSSKPHALNILWETAGARVSSTLP
jgi:hypothetical protein